MEGCWHKTTSCSLQRQLLTDFQAVITSKWSRKFYEKFNYRDNWQTPCAIIFFIKWNFFLFFFSSTSRIRRIAHSGFYEFHLLHDLSRSLLFCVCIKEIASTLVLLPPFPHVEANLVCIFLFCHSLRTLLFLSLHRRFWFYPDLYGALQTLAIIFLLLVISVCQWNETFSKKVLFTSNRKKIVFPCKIKNERSKIRDWYGEHKINFKILFFFPSDTSVRVTKTFHW
jgi:hypothetical protein